MPMNKVIICGRLGKDPELRRTSSGTAVVSLSVATSEVWNSKSGEKQEHTEWHNVTVWGKRAETCEKYLSKGREVLIEGKLRTEKWRDKEGHDRYTTKILADNVQFVGSRGQSDGSSRSQSSSSFVEQNDDVSFVEDDIPF